MRFRVPRPFLAAAALLLSASLPATGATGWPNVDPRIAPGLRGLLTHAAARLARAECSTLLSDFSDGRTGRPLAETLSLSGLDSDGWFRALWFVSGDGHAGCADRRKLAYAPVGGPVVFVCPAGFGRYRVTEPNFAATVLIHEVLHTLGLGENPPSSWEITIAVEKRCGR